MESKPATAQDLLDQGWRVRLQDDRHDLADGLFRRSLQLAQSSNDKQAAGNALDALASNLRWYRQTHLDEFYLSEDELHEAMELFRDVGDEAGIASCLRMLGQNEESLAICRRIDDRKGVIRSLSRLAGVAALQQNPEVTVQLCNEFLGVEVDQLGISFPVSQPPNETTRLFTEAVRLARELGDLEVLADTLRSAGVSCHDDDAYRQSAFLEAAALYRRMGYRRGRADSLLICAVLACDEDPTLKEDLLEMARSIWHELGRHSTEAVALGLLADLADTRGDRALAEELRDRSESVAMLADPY